MSTTALAQLGVAVIGCGLIGRRRARTAVAHPRTRLRAVVDSDTSRAEELADGVCEAGSDWRSVVERDDVDIVVVSTPNGMLADVAIAALERGRHVLMEKPMGRTLAEARRIQEAAEASEAVLQVGFNHRHHPAIARMRELVRTGAIGRLISIRARYGHGGRPGLENEWRSDPAQAGGGELIDQGVHIADLIHWLAGMPVTAYGVVQTAVWPITPMEDNAYGLLTFDSGIIAQLHVSMTQWKNLFSFEVHGEAGALSVEGLGGSYGVERLVHAERAFQGGAPQMHEERFDGEDVSWSREWEAFIATVETRVRAGVLQGEQASDAASGVAAMRIVDALYRSAHSGTAVTV